MWAAILKGPSTLITLFWSKVHIAETIEHVLFTVFYSFVFLMDSKQQYK